MEFDQAIALARALRDAGYSGQIAWAGSDPRTATVEIPLTVAGLRFEQVVKLAEAVPEGIDLEFRHDAIRFRTTN